MADPKNISKDDRRRKRNFDRAKRSNPSRKGEGAEGKAAELGARGTAAAGVGTVRGVAGAVTGAIKGIPAAVPTLGGSVVYGAAKGGTIEGLRGTYAGWKYSRGAARRLSQLIGGGKSGPKKDQALDEKIFKLAAKITLATGKMIAAFFFFSIFGSFIFIGLLAVLTAFVVFVGSAA